MIDPFITTLIFATGATVSGLYLLNGLLARRHVMLRGCVHLAEQPVSYWLFAFTCFGFGATSLIKALEFFR